MAWNEPPSGNNDKDPWGNPKKGNDGPPDLDELFKKMDQTLKGLLGKGRGGNRGNGSGPGNGASGSFIFIGLLIAGVAIAAVNSVYTVDARERGVVLRLGKFNAVTEPGLQFKVPFVDTVEKVVVTNIREYSDKSRMLTKDQNIVEVSYNIQWQATDARNFALVVQNPDRVLEHASESALRNVVGGSLMREVMTSSRSRLANEMKLRLQSLLDDYGTGIVVSQVNFADVSPPLEVRPAYDDVIKAEADEQRFKNEAERYSNQIIPEARGLAQRQIEEANGYREQIIARAEGEATRFNRLYAEYVKAPEVTRQRLYLETISEIYANTNKILVDVSTGNNLMYLPLDQIKRAAAATIANNANDSMLTSGVTNLSSSEMSELTDGIIEEFRKRGLIRTGN